MFAMDQNKTQNEQVLTPQDAGAGVIVSPDTRRANRVPPGQRRTLKWPILDAGGAPPIELERWKFSIGGLVAHPREWNWREFQELERVKVFSDFHCVTHWSRLGNTWEGVSTRKLMALVGGALAGAQYVLVRGYDEGFSTNLPLADSLAEDALVAFLHDGEPLTEEHGWPARLIVPQLYAWKSAKWIAGLEVLDHDKAGFWERNGYHMRGDPWKEERFGW
ncbi:MAG: sulfite oxidase-like oxidoreductase [Bryobacterales bacterium]|nr:sulfite oxidase-like oxidoreductase [Bryobacterales bacterium]